LNSNEPVHYTFLPDLDVEGQLELSVARPLPSTVRSAALGPNGLNRWNRRKRLIVIVSEAASVPRRSMANKVPGALRGVTFTAHTPTKSFFSTDCATSIVGINAHTAAKLINLFFIIVVFDVFFTAKRDTCKHPGSKDAVAIIQKLE
jgi:hypothetical protein